MDLRIYQTKQEVAQAFSEAFSNLIAQNTETHIALSGGSTPKIVFDYLAMHYADKIAWNTVKLYWGDERCVPPTDADSNYKMTVDHLVAKVPIPAENIFRIKGENSPEEEAVAYGKLLDVQLPKYEDIPQFDLVILGMGDDGHTASIFPHEIDLWESKENCEVAIHPESHQRRVSLTGKIINNAKQVAFLVTGDNKAEKLKEIIHVEGDYKSYPAALVKPKTKELVWFLDAGASAQL